MRAFYRKYHNIIETMLLLCILAGGFYWKYQEYRMQQTQQQIAEKILRFHVRANSNSRADQALKLKVRDAVGAYMQQQLDGVQDIRECSLIVQENLAQVIKTAQQAVAQEGYDYSVDARIETVAFPQKTYGNYTFPAGDYQALNVIIGSGKGQNWWCVLYPKLCFIDSTHGVMPEESCLELKNLLPEDDFDAVMASEPRIHIRFKLLEFLK